MRILYVANYQGQDLIDRRHIVRNRALGGSRKIELLTGMLRSLGHEVVVLSAGVAAERTGRLYPAFESTMPTEAGNPARVLYAAGFDARILNQVSATMSAGRWLRREVSRRPFDAVLIYNIDEYTVILAWLCRLWMHSVPIILEYEDSVAVTGRSILPGRQSVWRILEKWVQSRLSGVVAVNQQLADAMQNENSFVLPGVIAEDFCRIAPGRSAPMATGRPLTAAFAGSLTPDKGVDKILAVAERFRGQIKFVIAGTGMLYDQLVIEAAHCGGDVTVAGYLDRERLDDLLLTADILLNPHHAESSGGIFPFKVVEYLASGGIVLTTRAGNQVSEAFDYCEVFEPTAEGLAGALLRVLNNAGPAVERACAGQRWAISHFSVSAIASSLQRVIEAAVDGRH